MKQLQRRPRIDRALRDWAPETTRDELRWSQRPGCPLIPRTLAGAHGFLRDRLHVITGAEALPMGLTDNAVDATLRLMLRRGNC
ncbi:hypothetical protein M2352_002095 [Azospirillum fermentarium]|uniref:hypothetical protein n=1 Tax=Azospirillum fermentarium TaxID=1233114 RepID=UPI002227E64D|nr:hypothetical protein [Azospirillum fermentarium]MCW2246504.1 hypothetical protein [Azospirillum fermentarium]